jgi:AcrR family transcriptional regulator
VTITVNNLKVCFRATEQMESCGLQRKKQPAIGNAYPDRGRPVVSERGLSGVGVDALIDAAGLTHGSLYSQFGSKERLAAEALSHALSTSFARVRPVRRPSGTSRRWLRDRGSGGPPSEDQDTLWAVRRARDRMTQAAGPRRANGFRFAPSTYFHRN